MTDGFSKILLDAADPRLLGEDCVGIRNLFTEADAVGISPADPLVYRVFDLALLASLKDVPVIISSSIDLAGAAPFAHAAGLAIEAASRQDLSDLEPHAPDLIIAKSSESTGVAKECSALVLYQLLKRQARPFSIHANTGFELFQAYCALGVHGVVLPLPFLQGAVTSRLRFQLDRYSSLRLQIPGGAPKAPGYRERLQNSAPLDFLRETHEEGLWEDPLDPACLEAVARKLALYRQLSTHTAPSDPPPCFYEGSPAARALGTRFPIVQGPMSGVTVSPKFAQAVHDAGGFPFLALAGMPNTQVAHLVAETAALGIPFGVGIVAVSLSDADFEKQIACFERHRPALVLVGTPQMNHVDRLLRTDLPIAVHATNRQVFAAMYAMGVRRFVIEGEDAGGHVSDVGGLTAWQGVFDEIIARSIQDEVHIIVAGGLREHSATELLTRCLHDYGLGDVLKISEQLGTAYLATHEAREHTPIGEGFQQRLFSLSDTFVTGEALGRRVRQLSIESSADTVAAEWEIYGSGQSHEDKKREFERLYGGGLTRAVESTSEDPRGSYMAGASAALIDGPCSISDLHAALVDPAPIRGTTASEPIAIVGVGLKLPGAETLEDFFYNVHHQRCFVDEVPEDHFDRDVYLSSDRDEAQTSYTTLGALCGDIDLDFGAFRIPPVTAERLSRAQKMALDVCNKALRDAGFFEKPFCKERASVVIGAPGSPYNGAGLEWPRIRHQLEQLAAASGTDLSAELDAFEAEHGDDAPNGDTLTGGLTNIIAARIASVFDLKGQTYTIDAACASSLAAISQGVELLRDGRADTVLAGGVDDCTDVATYVLFSRLGALSADGSFPFDDRADGFVLGEGAVVYVLKRHRDALARGDKIYGVINGWGASSDGTGKGITAPAVSGQVRACRRAYADADVRPEDVEYVECHATATPVGDEAELESLAAVFASGPRERPLKVGASKAAVGHLKAAAGATGLLNCLYAMHSGHFPGVVNFRVREDLHDPQVVVHPRACRQAAAEQPLLAGLSAYGFGGTNYHLVLSRPEANKAEGIIRPERLLTRDYGLASDLAYVCPGQGSQFEGMLREVAQHPVFEELAPTAREIFAEYSDADLLSLLTEVDETRRQEHTEMLRSAELSQPAIFFASAVLGRMLLDEGPTPMLFLGHSQGEYAALYLAGALSFEDAMRMICTRGQVMAAAKAEDPGTMIALMGGEDLARRLILSTEHYAACANLNAYDQTVISCADAAVSDVLAAADQLGVRATVLKVARGYHSALMTDCKPVMLEALERCSFRYPRAKVGANVTFELYPFDPDAVGEVMSPEHRAESIRLLHDQIDHPVRFLQQIQSAYFSGARRFVEAGPGNILTRLINGIHKGKYLQALYLLQHDEPLRDVATVADALAQELTIERTPIKKTAPRKRRARQSTQPATDDAASPLEQIRAAVSDISGYALGDFGDDAEFERDLGIDTIKIFEIIARLRGNVLPQELTDFRSLNSVTSLLAATSAEPAAPSAGQDAHRTEDPIRVFQFDDYAATVEERLIDDLGAYDIHADDPALARPSQSTRKLYLFPAAGSADDVLDRLARNLFEKTRGFRDVEATEVVYVSYGPDPRGATTYSCCSAFVNSIARNFPEMAVHYSHLESLDGLESRLRPGIGLREHGDAVYRGALRPVDRFQATGDELPLALGAADHVVVTGGARGIAAHVIEDIFDRCEARFTILGRKPNVEDWIQAKDPARIRYIAVDVTDGDAVRAQREAFADCTLLVHGAGIEVSKNFDLKSFDEFSNVVDVKVRGFANMMAVLDRERLRAVVQFSSTAAFFGNPGQSDYAFANAYLNEPELGVPCLALGWNAWSQIGMASRGMIRELLETSGVTFITPARGAQIFRDALTSFLLNPFAEHTRLVISPNVENYGGGVVSPDRARHSLADLDYSIALQRTFESARHPELMGHVIDGRLMLPGSIMLGTLLDQMSQHVDLMTHPVTLTDIDFFQPLVLTDGGTNALMIRRRPQGLVLEERTGGATQPIFGVTIGPRDAGAPVILTGLKERFEQTGFNLRPPTLAYYRSDLCLTGDFRVLSNVAHSNGVFRSRLDVSEPGTGLLGRCGGISRLLEAAFQISDGVAHYVHSRARASLPKACSGLVIDIGALHRSRRIDIYVLPIAFGEQSNELSFQCVSDLGEQVMSAQSYTDASVLKLTLSDCPLFTNSPVRDREGWSFAANIAELNRAFPSSSGFTPAEQAEIDALGSEKRRAEKRAGKLACKLLVVWDTLGDGEAVDALRRVEVLSQDQPVRIRIDGQAPTEFPYASITHSDGCVMVGRAERPFGLDLEAVRPLDRVLVEDLYRSQRGEIEAAASTVLASKPEFADRIPLTVFTQKEAALKAAGIGLAQGPDAAQFETLSFGGGNGPSIVRVGNRRYEVWTTHAERFVVSRASCSAPGAAHAAPAGSGLGVRKPILPFHAALARVDAAQSVSYSMNHTLSFEHLDLDALCESLNRVVEENEILRARFDLDQERVSIQPFVPRAIEAVATTEDLKELEIAFVRSSGSYKYPANAERLFRIEVYRQPSGAGLVAMNFSHLIMDCYNAHILSDDLLRFYHALSDGGDLGPPRKKLQFFDLDNLAPASPSRVYWERKLAGARLFRFPAQDGAVANADHFRRLSPFDEERFRARCQERGVTLFTGLCAILKACLRRLYERGDILLFFPFTLKNQENYEAIGPFANLLPLRVEDADDVYGDPALRAVSEAVYEAVGHSLEPWDYSIAERNDGIIVELLESAPITDSYPDVAVGNTDGKNLFYPLTVSFLAADGEIRAELAFDPERVGDDDIRRLITAFNDERERFLGTRPALDEERVYDEHPPGDGEALIRALWAEVLGHDGIGRHDNFFALGGSSLQLVDFVSRYNARNGQRIPYGLPFLSPTVAQLAAAIGERVHAARSNDATQLVHATDTGTAPTLLWAHGGIHHVVQKFGTSHNVLEVTDYHLAPPEAPHYGFSIEDFVSEFLDGVDLPETPFIVGGYSVGGTLAAELCRRLVEMGRDVQGLFLVDPPLDAFMSAQIAASRSRRSRREHLVGFVQDPRGSDLPKLVYRQARRRIEQFLELRRARRVAHQHITPSQEEIREQGTLAYHQAYTRYRYATMPVRAQIILRESLYEPFGAYWRELCPGAVIASTAVDHLDLIRPEFVDTWITELHEFLQESVQQGSGSTTSHRQQGVI